MSINRFLATITIALAGFGTACSSTGVDDLSPEAAEAIAEILADEATTETPAELVVDEGPAQPVPTMANGEPLDEAYVMDLQAQMEAATTYQEHLAATSAFVTYMDSAPVQDGVTSSWNVDENAVEELAAMYGATVEEVQAAIDADPALVAMFASAEQAAAPAEETTTEDPAVESGGLAESDAFDDVFGDEVDDQLFEDSLDEWEDPGFEDTAWTEAEFVSPEWVDVTGPWGAYGDHGCSAAVAHIESDGDYRGSFAGDLTGSYSFVTAFFPTIDDAAEVMDALDHCEAWRVADQFAAALGLPVLDYDLIMVIEDGGVDWSQRVFVEPDTGITVVFIQDYGQVFVHVTDVFDEYTALEEAYMLMGY